MSLADASSEKRALLLASVLLAAVGSNCSKAPAWEALPLGTSADFRAIWFTDANHGWIAGGGYNIVGGLIGRTEDAGSTWRFTSNLTSRERMSLPALHFFDSRRGLVATGGGAILKTTDGGENWTTTTVEDMPILCRAFSSSMNAVAGRQATATCSALTMAERRGCP